MTKAHIITPLAIFTLSLVSCGTDSTVPGDNRSSQDVLGTAQARAEATRAATFQTPPPTPITPSPTPPAVTETIAPTVTPTPSTPIVVADYNAYVRSGPDETYESIDFLLQGQRAAILGMFENELTGTWWYVDRIDEGKDGWVWSGAVTVSGDLFSVPVLEAPPQ